MDGHGKEKDHRPFFAVLSVQPPHSPYVPPTNPAYGRPPISPARIELRRNVPDVPWVREKARLDLAGYYGMVENLDWNLGRIRQALEKWGVDRETYVIFFSDHGDMLGSHAQWEKSSPWEESIRIPFVVGSAGERAVRRGRTPTWRSTTWTSRRPRWPCAGFPSRRIGRVTTTARTASTPGVRSSRPRPTRQRNRIRRYSSRFRASSAGTPSTRRGAASCSATAGSTCACRAMTGCSTTRRTTRSSRRTDLFDRTPVPLPQPVEREVEATHLTTVFGRFPRSLRDGFAYLVFGRPALANLPSGMFRQTDRFLRWTLCYAYPP